MNQSYPSVDWKKFAPSLGLVGGGLIGLLGLSMLGLLKDKKTMTKFEKTAVAFIGALCDKIEELQDEIEKLRKTEHDTVPRKTYTETVQSYDKIIQDLHARIAELEKKPKPKPRKTQEATV